MKNFLFLVSCFFVAGDNNSIKMLCAAPSPSWRHRYPRVAEALADAVGEASSHSCALLSLFSKYAMTY